MLTKKGIDSMDFVYMQVTMDKYELPVAIANSLDELSKITGASKNTISSAISHAKYNKEKYKHSKYVKVILDNKC